MTLDALRCFCAIVESGSFRAAAKRIARSQPAVSQQIKSLEEELGQQLIDRKTGRATPVGEMFYKRARSVILAVDAMIHEAGDFADGAGGELRVGASDTTALYVLPKYVRRFAALYPDTRLVLTSRSSAAIEEQVLRGDLDLGIITMPCGQPELEAAGLFREELVLTAPHSHPIMEQAEITLADLRFEPLLLLDAKTRTGSILRAFFAEERFQPQIMLDSSSFEVIKRYTIEGLGLSFLPAAAAMKFGERPAHATKSTKSGEQEQLVTARVRDLPVIPLGAVWRRNAWQSRTQQAFLELLREDLSP
jgi:DNA-binding transcriptional LysR family regulator